MLGRIIEIDGEHSEGRPSTLGGVEGVLRDGQGHEGAHQEWLRRRRGPGGGQRHDDDGLTATEPKKFSMLAARLNYMAQDNPMVQLPAKEVCKHMSNWRAYDFINIKRIVRFMIGIGKVGLKFEWQDENDSKQAKVHIDNDWAGCKITRKSASGAVLKVGRHIIKTWSSIQSTVAAATGEAELLAMYDGASRGVGLVSIVREMGASRVLSWV